MTITLKPTPLHQYAAANTRSIDEMRRVASGIFGSLKLDATGNSTGFHAQINFCPLPNTALYYGFYAQPLKVQFPESNFFAQGITLQGAGSIRVNGTERIISTTDLPSPVPRASKIDINFGAGHEHLALYMQPHAIMRKLGAMTGGAIQDNLVLMPGSRSQPETRLLTHLINLMVSEVDDTERPVSPLVIAELEQSVIVAFLVSHSHNYSHLFAAAPKPQAPWQVRRAEEYIEANWDRSLSIETLAETLNASVRSIYYSFKETRGYSPMAFLKQVRLRHAKDMLSYPEESTSVTGVAYACGFGNLGHFAKNYFQAFREYPSDTLNSAKGIKR